MANVATAQTPLQVGFKHSGMGGFIVPVICSFDTVDSDLTIYTPTDADAYLALVGLQYAEASAHSLTIKSDTTTLITYEMPVNSIRDLPIGDRILLSTLAKGVPLKFRCGTAGITSLLAHVMEYKNILLG